MLNLCFDTFMFFDNQKLIVILVFFTDLVSEYQQYQEATAEDEGEFDEEEEEEMA